MSQLSPEALETIQGLLAGSPPELLVEACQALSVKAGGDHEPSSRAFNSSPTRDFDAKAVPLQWRYAVDAANAIHGTTPLSLHQLYEANQPHPDFQVDESGYCAKPSPPCAIY